MNEQAPPAANPMEILAEAMAHLAHISTLHLATNVSRASSVMRPTPFRGESGDDARRFLAAFTMWAMAQGTGMNVVDEQGNAVGRRNVEWIRAALSFMQDDAAIWAAPAMEQFAAGTVPFGSDWARFHAEFKARFETVDEAVDAKEKLRTLWQNESSVPEYAARFKQLMARTGYSPADLRDRYYEHLTSRVKDELVHTARPIITLDELITVTSDIDTRLRQRKAERDRERRRTGPTTPGATGQPVTTTAPFTTPERDPNSMDVDATRTKETFLKKMRGRCFGCGSTIHAKKDGNHERDLCAYCKRVGHRENVCMEKYLGRQKSQKAAATEDFDLSDVESVSSISFSETSQTAASTSVAKSSEAASSATTSVVQIAEQTKALYEQIKQWREEDF